MNEDAVVVWMYLQECSRTCGGEASTDFEFVRLLFDMLEHYPVEFDAVDYVIRNLKGMGYDVY